MENEALENCTRVQGVQLHVVWVQSNLHGTTSVKGRIKLVAVQHNYVYFVGFGMTYVVVVRGCPSAKSS